MPNLFDYLEWRGDLSFSESPINEVDGLALSLLAYVDLEGVVPGERQEGRITLRAAAAEYFFANPEPGDHPLGLIIPADILTLFRRMARTRRFRDLELTGYVNEISEIRETQFSALTVLLPDDVVFVAFRGTDDTIVGWKEDFKLSYVDEVPAQTRSAAYLNGLDLMPDTALCIGGHSKGGNLAVWSSVHAGEGIRRRIRQVYSFDGPGFSEGTVQSEAYRGLAPRIRVILPEDSLVGLLLEHDNRYTVIKSNRRGLFQHDGLSWEVLGGQFIRVEGLSKRGIHADTVVRKRIDAMTVSERREVVQLMFSLLEATGAATLTELHSGKFKAALSMMKAFRELPAERQETAAYLWDKLVNGKEEPAKRGSRKSGTPLLPASTDRGQATSKKEEEKKRRKAGFAKNNLCRPQGRIRISLFPLFLP